MKKWVIAIIFIPIYLLITFFGMGPIFLADGPAVERLFTLLVVIIIYIVITWILIKILKKDIRH